MELRPIEPGDGPALTNFFARIPESDRTFLKEDVEDPDVVAQWARPGTARTIAVEDGEVIGSVAVVPLHGGPATLARSGWWSIPQRAARASAGHWPARRCSMRWTSGSPSWWWRSSPTKRRSSACSGRWGSSRRPCWPTTCATVGDVRDLLVLAQDVEAQFAAMGSAGITEQL